MKANPVITLNPNELLVKYCKQKRIYKAALARKMQVDYKVIIRTLKSKQIKFNLLVEFCHGLQHNFLLDLAMQLPSQYTTNIEQPSSVLEIAELKARIQTLETENALLEKIVMKPYVNGSSKYMC